MTPTEWLRRFEAADACIRNIYGDEAVFQESRNVWEETLRCFLARFGDREVRLFRSPGRLNLRGMHVDTHGGFLNLTTCLLYTSPSPRDRTRSRMPSSA